LLSGEIAGLFSRYATWVRISIDGWDDKSYSAYRRVREGEFSKVIRNIRNFKKTGGNCYLGVSIIVNKLNASHIYDLVLLLRDSGVDSVKMAPCIVSNKGAENNIYHKRIFKIVKKQIAKAMDKCTGKGFEIFDSYHTQLGSFAKPYSWCPYLQILPVIGADLNIYPCQDKAYNLDQGLIGSIKKEGFKHFWFSGKNKFFKINPQKVCNHHCVANEKNRIILEYLGADKEHLGFV
jgi:MoaA/NifB/PqqE/SkfB family radical SAM enzyme